MLALLRPDSWDFPLFLHVLGATTLVGAVGATALAASYSEGSVLLRRVAFWAITLVALPAWVLMRLSGQWTDSREDIPGDPTWLSYGYLVGDVGLIVLLVTAVVGWWSSRKPEQRWPAQAVTALTSFYLIGLLVAMWAMTTKPD